MFSQGRFSGRVLRAGLDGDAVVPHVDHAVGDAHVTAAVGVDAVGIGGIGGVFDGEAA